MWIILIQEGDSFSSTEKVVSSVKYKYIIVSYLILCNTLKSLFVLRVDYVMASLRYPGEGILLRIRGGGI